MMDPRELTKRATIIAAMSLAVGCSARSATDNMWDKLRKGGYAVLFRHATTDTGHGEPPGYVFGRPDTQRQLTVAGRRQAALIGEAFRANAVPVGEVFSSAWQRCRDTAQLAFGRHEVWPALNVLSEEFNPEVRRAEQTASVRQRISQPLAGANLILVTHWYNIEAAVGAVTREGEGVIVRSGAAPTATPLIQGTLWIPPP